MCEIINTDNNNHNTTDFRFPLSAIAQKHMVIFVKIYIDFSFSCIKSNYFNYYRSNYNDSYIEHFDTYARTF